MDSQAQRQEHQPPFPKFNPGGSMRSTNNPRNPEIASTSEMDTNNHKAISHLEHQPTDISKDLFPSSNCLPHVKFHPPDSTKETISASGQFGNQDEAIVKDDFTKWRVSFTPKSGESAIDCYEKAKSTPPISTLSLRELEMESVNHNAKLRHDINFDHDLQFRPNIEGDPGKLKAMQAREYWIALEVELELYEFMLSDPDGQEYLWTPEWVIEFHKCQRRFPRMFEAMKLIILGMMPAKDRPKVEETLDIPLIMEQIGRACLDRNQFASWLSSLLKSHCAPVRDAWVDKMASQMAGKADETPAKSIVNGLKELFGILEAMKLDIANHQIRVLRPMLISSTFNFEFLDSSAKLTRYKTELFQARCWYDRSRDDGTEAEGEEPDIVRFVSCLIASLLPTTETSASQVSNSISQSLPPTFYLDYDRLSQLRRQISFAVNEEICILCHETMLQKLGRSKSEVNTVTSEMRASIQVIVDNSWEDQERVFNVAAEMVRLAMTANPTNDRSNRQRGMWEPSTSQHNVQLTDLIEEAGNNLLTQLRDEKLLKQQTKALGARICARVKELVQQHMKNTPLELFESLVGDLSVEHKFGHVPESVREDGKQSPNSHFSQICRRLTHIIVLHWRAWRSLVYTCDVLPSKEGESGESMETTDSSDNESSASCSENSVVSSNAEQRQARRQQTQTPEIG